MVPIEPDDEWRVTHVVPEGYFIQSKMYTKRLCKTYGRGDQWDEWGDQLNTKGCGIRFDLAISVTKDGSILDGWQLLATQLGENWFWHEINYASAGWPTGVVFVPSTK